MSSTTRPRPKVLKGADAVRATQAVHTNAIAAFDPATLAAARNPGQAAETERRTGYELGYAEGLDAARGDIEAAMEDSNKRVRRALAALCEAVESFDNRQTLALAEVEDAIVAGALELARVVLQREVTVAADPGAEAISRALQLAPERGDITARLHPDDVETLSLERVSTTARTINVVADPRIELGGCIVETGTTRVDSQLSTALTRAREAMALTLTQAAEATPPAAADAP